MESDSYHQFSPKLSASYALDDHTNLYLSLGNRLRRPSLPALPVCGTVPWRPL
ncbi:MAG: hypothetical protein ACLUIQ_04695 [Dialister invisus]